MAKMEYGYSMPESYARHRRFSSDAQPGSRANLREKPRRPLTSTLEVIMSPSAITIEIHTEDRTLLSDLRSENLPDVRLSTRAFTCDSPDWIPPVEKILTFIVDTSSTVSLSLLSAWLYDRFKKKVPEKVIVNNITIVNHQEIANVINNYIKVEDSHQSKSQ